MGYSVMMKDQTMPRPTRTISIRCQALVERVRRFEDNNEPWERGLIATRVWRDSPNLPLVRKKAEVVAQCLEQIRPIVLPEDRVVGIVSRRLRIHGGVGSHDAWRIVVRNPETRGYHQGMPIPGEADEELRWWADHANQCIGRQAPNKERNRYSWMSRYAIAQPHGRIQGHTLPAHDILLNSSIPELRHRICRRLQHATATERDELQAIDRCLEGLQNHYRLSATELEATAANTDDPRNSDNLLVLADICRGLAEHAPQTFHEALQALYASNTFDMLDNAGDASSFGRIDQILHPFYERDVATGHLTEEEAFELVCAFIAKKWCVQTSNNLTVGGMKSDGTDGTNDLSAMFLEAMLATTLTTDISVRIHSETPDDFLLTVAEAMRAGYGRAGCFNDDVMIEALTRKDVELEDARDYAPLGCVEVMIPGRSAFRTMSMGMNLAKLVELTIHAGHCSVTGDRVFADVPDDFPDYQSFLDCYHKLEKRVVDAAVEIIREDERLEPEMNPRPTLTLLTYGGIEKAKDITAGLPKYDPVGVTLSELATAVNSLVAVKTFVYDQKRLTLPDLRRVLKEDWEGREALRQEAIEQLPRFGQDDRLVNELVRQEAAFYASCFEPHRTYYGGRFWPMIFGVSTGMQRGIWPKVGALPSGKTSKGPMAYSLQPEPRTPSRGITSVLNSCAAIDFTDYPGGTSNVQDCTADLFAGTGGLQRMAAVLRAYFASGGMEVALNFLSETKLRAAQEEPKEYRNLMVRLFGLSARFVELDDDLQEGIIARARDAQR